MSCYLTVVTLTGPKRTRAGFQGHWPGVPICFSISSILGIPVQECLRGVDDIGV